MARPRGFDIEVVVEAAKDTFWRLGYDGAAISDLEEATGLSRSSLYQAFGSKEQLFRAALDRYIRMFMGPLLAPMEAPKADLGAIEGFFTHLGRLFGEDGLPARYGCLWVNSIVDLNRRRPAPADARSEEYWARINGAFTNSLAKGAARERVGLLPAAQRAGLLAGGTFGCWLVIRIDTSQAETLCEGLLAEVRSWRQLAAGA